MFEKLTKKLAGKATDNAVEGVKKNINDRIDQYGDMIQIGLVIGVTVWGLRHLTKRSSSAYMPEESYIPCRLPGGQQPIVINNYYREREDRYEQRYNKRNAYIGSNGQVCQGAAAQTAYPQRKGRR